MKSCGGGRWRGRPRDGVARREANSRSSWRGGRPPSRSRKLPWIWPDAWSPRVPPPPGRPGTPPPPPEYPGDRSTRSWSGEELVAAGRADPLAFEVEDLLFGAAAGAGGGHLAEDGVGAFDREAALVSLTKSEEAPGLGG